MVGLFTAAGDHSVGAVCERVGEQELELADLVARQLRAGQIVALDQHLHAECIAGARQSFQRRGGACELDSIRISDGHGRAR